MSDKPDTPYWVVIGCPTCGRRIRASALERYWQRGSPSFDDAEAMVTRSEGFRRLQNVRGPLWIELARVGSAKLEEQIRHAVGCFFQRLEDRLKSGAEKARDASYRAFARGDDRAGLLDLLHPIEERATANRPRRRSSKAPGSGR